MAAIFPRPDKFSPLTEIDGKTAAQSWFDFWGYLESQIKSLAGSVASSRVTGTTTNDNAAAGIVGEYISSTSGAVGLASATNTNLTSIALTAGDWDLAAGFIASGGGTTNMTDLWVSINTVTAVNVFLQGQSFRVRGFTQVDPASASAIGPFRVSLAAPATYFLNAQSTFTGTAVSVTGIIRARRVR